MGEKERVARYEIEDGRTEIHTVRVGSRGDEHGACVIGEENRLVAQDAAKTRIFVLSDIVLDIEHGILTDDPAAKAREVIVEIHDGVL